MSNKDLMKFDIDADTVIGVYEYEHGRWKIEDIDWDEVYAYSDGVVTKIESEHGQLQITQYADFDADGIFQEYGEWRVQASYFDNLSTLASTISNTVPKTPFLYQAEESREPSETYVVNGVTYTETADDIYVGSDGSVVYEQEAHESSETYVVNGVTYTETADDIYVGSDGSVVYEQEAHESSETYVVNGVTYTETADDIYVGSDGSVVSEFLFKHHSSPEKTLQNGRLHVKTSDDLLMTDSLDFAAALRNSEKSADTFKLEMEADTSNSVDISDVIAQLRHIVGIDTLQGINHAAGDFDSDGAVGISDVISNLRVIVGLENTRTAKVVDQFGHQDFALDTIATELYVIAPGDVDLSWSPADII
jgi:hypothetical protein